MSDFNSFIAWGFDNVRAFRGAELILARYGFTDSSCRNDTSPSLARARLEGETESPQLFIDRVDPRAREFTRAPVCNLVCNVSGDYIPFKSVSYVVRYIRRNFPQIGLETL